MEVHLPPELEARLAQRAKQQGRDAAKLAEAVLSRYLDDQARFLESVEKGIAAAERGEFIEEDEMNARVERMFRR